MTNSPLNDVTIVVLSVCLMLAAIVATIYLIHIIFASMTNDLGYKYFREKCKNEIKFHKKNLEIEQTRKIAEISNNMEKEYQKRLAEEKRAYSDEILSKVRKWMQDNDISYKEGEVLYGSGSKEAAQEASGGQD